uniref:Flavodoxin-like fold domain-containing protein n=1 Tax=Sinocyclocheilus grahami TaxID=75366 RepID=A0A672M7U2_SINGR
MAQKTALIVYAHQSPASFNAAARDVAVQALTKQGYKVLVSDLYAMNFKASATAEDIKGDLKNPEHFIYNNEMMVAWQDGRLSDDIAEEQHKLEQAELVIFQAKKAILSFTTGGTESMFKPDGVHGDINVPLCVQHSTLHFLG